MDIEHIYATTWLQFNFACEEKEFVWNILTAVFDFTKNKCVVKIAEYFLSALRTFFDKNSMQ